MDDSMTFGRLVAKAGKFLKVPNGFQNDRGLEREDGSE